MPSPSGWPHQLKNVGNSQFQTIQQAGLGGQWAADVVNRSVFSLGDDLTEANSTQTVLVATGHSALAGDVIRFDGSSANPYVEIGVYSVDVNNITLYGALPNVPGVGDGFAVLRYVTPQLSSSGGIVTTAGPLQVLVDGVATEVDYDTGTPANSIPVPVYITGGGASGALDYGASSAASRTAAQIGNATGAADFNAGNSSAQTLRVVVATNQTTLPISAASLPLPTGAATESTLSTIRTDLGTVIKNPGVDNIVNSVVVAGRDASDVAQALSISADGDLEVALASVTNNLNSSPVSGEPSLLVGGYDYSSTRQFPLSVDNFGVLNIGSTTLATEATLLSIATPLIDSVAAAGGGVPANVVMMGGISGGTTARRLAVDANGELQVDVLSSALPTGAATEATLSAMSAKLPASLGAKAGSASLSIVPATDYVTPAPAITAGTITNAQITVGTSAVRATVSGSAPNAARKKLMIKPSKNNTGAIYLGSSSVTTANGMEIIGPDRLAFEFDAADYYLISDTAAQVVEIVEKV